MRTNLTLALAALLVLPSGGVLAQGSILSTRPITEGLTRPSIGGDRLPDSLARPDTQTTITPQRRIIRPQQQVCRTEPVLRRTPNGSVVDHVRRCWLAPGR